MKDERKEAVGGGRLLCISIFIVAMVHKPSKVRECTLEGLEAFLLQS